MQTAYIGVPTVLYNYLQEENRHIKAKRTERQKREEKVRRFLQRRGGAGRGDGGGLVFDPQSLSSLLPGLH